MKAMVYAAFGERLREMEMPDPEVLDGGVVIRVRAAGVCRSDWHAWQGHDPDIKVLPHVPGHEFAGEIAAVGRGVRRWREGDLVTVPFACGCGGEACEECAAGQAQVCPRQYQPGFSGAGAFAELVAVPSADFNVVRLPEGVSFAGAAALGCRFATAFRALVHADQAAVREGEMLVVFGCGGVGLSVVMIAVALGARVLAVDPRGDAREKAMGLGAEMVSGVDGALEVVREWTGGRGAEVAVEAVGRAEVCAMAVRSLRPRGRMVQIGLLLGKHADPVVPMGLVIARELRIIGSHGMAAAAYPEMLAMVADGRLRPERLMGRVIGFGEIPGALAAMTTNEGAAGAVVAAW